MGLIKQLKVLLALAKVVKIDLDGSVHFKSDVQSYSVKFEPKVKRRKRK